MLSLPHVEYRSGPDALLVLLDRVQWSVFATFTFRGSAPPQQKAVAAFWAWLRTSARVASPRFDWRRLPVVVRWERGGINGRGHLHCLIGPWPSGRVTKSLCHTLEHVWSGVSWAEGEDGKKVATFTRSPKSLAYGFAEVRPYAQGDGGLVYLLKQADQLEFSRFGNDGGDDAARSLHLTDALVKSLQVR